jgi:quercetin dioxygenase-like cupin family protein
VKIIKRSQEDIPKEEAHGGSGARKMYASPDHMQSEHFEAMTHGYLPAGNSFDWHDHTDTEEIMVVQKGSGKVYDDDGEYGYGPGDIFIFPANVRHKIYNDSDEEHEMLFVRVKL